jgi:hypothetical protein
MRMAKRRAQTQQCPDCVRVLQRSWYSEVELGPWTVTDSQVGLTPSDAIHELVQSNIAPSSVSSWFFTIYSMRRD